MAESSQSPIPSPAKKRARKRLHTRLHRWLGMASLAILLIIAVTGIALNHTVGLKLDERHLTWSPLLKLYGIEPKEKPRVFAAGTSLLAAWEGQVILDSRIVEWIAEEEALIGAGPVEEDRFAFAFSHLLLVIDQEGQVLERLDETSLPESAIARAGLHQGRLILETEDAQTFVLKEGFEVVPTQDAPSPNWFTPLDSPTAEQQEQLATAIRGEGLPLSRILLDLHSGRIFGTVGVILYDLAAICLVILGITGTMLWFRRR